jgi:probable rRNA maturation factor
MSDDGDTPRILVSNRQDAPIDEDELVELARRTLVAEGLRRSELSLSFVGVDEIADLQARYADEDGPTDVLSFPLDPDDRDEDGVRLLGDVVISPAVAATDNPADPAAEMRLLLVHGILHLLGHDHHDDEGRAAMWALQERYAGVRIA